MGTFGGNGLVQCTLELSGQMPGLKLRWTLKSAGTSHIPRHPGSGWRRNLPPTLNP